MILSAAEMAATDKRTAEEFGVPLADLMEQAGGAVARFCLRRYARARRVVVLCGRGNNGGDGLVAARVLQGAGCEVRVVLLGRQSELKGEAAGALERLRVFAAERGLLPALVVEILDEAGLVGMMEGAELVVDAVVGTGFTPPLRGLAVGVREMLDAVRVPVVAVDLPSGWDADSVEERVEGVFRADAVVTFTAPKRAHVFGNLTSGAVVLAEIGSPEGALRSDAKLSWTGSCKALAETPRAMNSNKGRFGHVLVVGGSWGKAGAPGMASLAALRAGAGLVTAAVPEKIVAMVGGIAPELMVQSVEFSCQKLDTWRGLLEGKKVVAVGPGLGTEGEVPEFVRGLVAETKVPMVLDADALNAFAGKTALLDGTGRVMVLTPHPGEMGRLVGMTVAEVEADRVGLARRFAVEHKVTLVLKGWRTLVAHPDGRVAVNTTGNPAMAKGGSGDVLTGIVAALLGQYPDDPGAAVEAAVYLHGLAGDFAARAMDEHTVLATDTVTHLSDAFRYRVEDEDGLVWICGMPKA